MDVASDKCTIIFPESYSNLLPLVLSSFSLAKSLRPSLKMSGHFLRDNVLDPFKDGFGWPFSESPASRHRTDGRLTDLPKFTVVDNSWGGFVEGPAIQEPRELVNETQALVNGDESDESELEVCSEPLRKYYGLASNSMFI